MSSKVARFKLPRWGDFRTASLLPWLHGNAVQYIVAAVMATALASGYLVAYQWIQITERGIAVRLTGSIERMVSTARAATPELSALLGEPCEAIRNGLTERANFVPYIRAAVLVRNGRMTCSSQMGPVAFAVAPLFPTMAGNEILALASGSPMLRNRPVLAVFERVHANDGVYYLIDFAYLMDALRQSVSDGADRVSIHVRGTGTLTQAGEFLPSRLPAASVYRRAIAHEAGPVSALVGLSLQRTAVVFLVVEVLFGTIGALVSALLVAIYLGAFAPERRLLRAAALGLTRGEFYLVYQPLVDVATRQWIGAEALVRWLHPKLGPLTPQAFIDVIEASPLIDALTQFVLRTALRETGAFGVPPHWHLAVNVTPGNISSPDFATFISQAIRDSGTQCTVTVEVTERELLAYDQDAIAAFSALQHCDVKLAVDDFGTENSNIDLLGRYDFDFLKIDRQYIARLGTEKSRLVHGICALASHLGARVIAEGVETETQHRALEPLGVTIAQGYLYQKPVAADEFTRLYLAQRHGRVPAFSS